MSCAATPVPSASSSGVIPGGSRKSVEWHHREPRGITEQRYFLLGRAEAEPVLFLDDGVYMEPFVVERLLSVLKAERCGFVGAFPVGLTFIDDVRPDQQKLDLWEGPVEPEVLEVEGPGWERWHLHRAANLYHLAQNLDLPPGEFLRYKVAWLGSCVLYSKEKLLEVGGFSFWERLPRYHTCEDAVVQNLLMRRYGGCGIVPAGTYHAEVETTPFSPTGTIDADARGLMPELIERFASYTLTELDLNCELDLK